MITIILRWIRLFLVEQGYSEPMGTFIRLFSGNRDCSQGSAFILRERNDSLRSAFFQRELANSSKIRGRGSKTFFCFFKHMGIC